MARVEFRFLDREDVSELLPAMAETMAIVEEGLAAHGRGEVVLPPKAHIHLDDRYHGHFNVLPGWAGHIDTAGVKIVGDYVRNYRFGLPSEVGMLTLYDPRTGVPLALMDATTITAHRTGAVTGIGAKHLAAADARVLGHLGARGSAFSNIAAVAAARPLQEVRITSKRPETREKLAARVRTELGIAARAVATAEEAVRGADIVVEATRLETPEILIEDRWLERGSLLVTFGWVMATDPRTVRSAGKVVVDDWAQCCQGGQLYPLIASGELTRERIHAEIGEIACGRKPGRTDAHERIVFWHRGFAISDIVLGRALLERAEAKARGKRLVLFDQEDE